MINLRQSFHLALIVLFSCSHLFGQNLKLEKPNYSKIEKAIKKDQSELYYPKLMQRFLDSDTNMSLEEKRHLYYGFSFQPGYAPYGHSDYEDSLNSFLQKGSPNEQEYEKMIRFADSALLYNPFNNRVINAQLVAYEKLGNSDSFDKKLNQMRIIFDALFSSGDGRSKKTAFYVIYTSHEYDLLNVLDFEFGGEQGLIEHYDYLKVAPNSYGIEGLYFDVSPCLNSLKFK